jgi:hypothetical protein
MDLDQLCFGTHQLLICIIISYLVLVLPLHSISGFNLDLTRDDDDDDDTDDDTDDDECSSACSVHVSA